MNKEVDSLMHIEEENTIMMDVQEMVWYKELKAEETPGGNLRFYRRLAHMNQTELGNKLGISKQFVSNMENGSKPISRNMALKLGALFDVPAGRFI
jgi:DNA-binding XRE family transcriptional regulator